MSCLDNIVSVGVCDEAGTSGFKLIDAAGISASTLAKIADDDNHTGMSLALSKKTIAIIKVKNDFVNMMVANAVTADVSTISYASGDLTSTLQDTSALYRGVVVHKANPSDRIKKTYLKAIHFIPSASGTINMRIEDGNNVLSFAVAATGGVMNSIDVSTITSNQKPYEVMSGIAKVLILDNGVQLYSSNITCLKGCSGRIPNPCAWVDGWDGSKYVKSNGFGLSVEFNCECDYDEVLCNLANSLVGELVYIAWQIEIMQEQMMSGRFNNIVTYGVEDIRDTWLPSLKAEYKAKWGAVASNIKAIVSKFNSDCVNCRGIKWVTNL